MIWIEALRVRQWHKNLLVAVPLVFSFRLFDPAALVLTATLIVAFCLASSAVYLVNDLCDRAADRQHPMKSHRPIASGKIRFGAALIIAVLLAAVAIALAILRLPMAATGALVSYLALQVLYNLALRGSAGADVISVALGFVLRAVGGALALNVPFSEWLLICTFFGAARLALGKRQGELIAAKSGLRRGWENVAAADLKSLGVLTSAVLVVSYTHYCFASRTAVLLGHAASGWAAFPPLLMTLPVVFYGVMRYELVAGQGGAGEPELLLFRDRSLALAVFGWMAVSVASLYAGRLASP